MMVNFEMIEGSETERYDDLDSPPLQYVNTSYPTVLKGPVSAWWHSLMNTIP